MSRLGCGGDLTLCYVGKKIFKDTNRLKRKRKKINHTNSIQKNLDKSKWVAKQRILPEVSRAIPYK